MTLKKQQPRIKVIAFDLDGTLLNTLEHVVQAFARVMTEHGETPDRPKIIAAIGPPLVDCYKTLLPRHDALKAADRHHELQQGEEFLDLIEEYVGLRETLSKLHADGLKAVVFTNRWRRGVDMIFAKVDLHKEFDLIVTPESVKNGKPDPEGLFLIAKKLGVEVDEIAMVGDLPVDMQVAKNAGAGPAIGITHGFGTAEELKAAGADYIIDSLDAVPGVI